MTAIRYTQESHHHHKRKKYVEETIDVKQKTVNFYAATRRLEWKRTRRYIPGTYDMSDEAVEESDGNLTLQLKAELKEMEMKFADANQKLLTVEQRIDEIFDVNMKTVAERAEKERGVFDKATHLEENIKFLNEKQLAVEQDFMMLRGVFDKTRCLEENMKMLNEKLVAVEQDFVNIESFNTAVEKMIQCVIKMNNCFMKLQEANQILHQSTYDQIREELILVDKSLQVKKRKAKDQG